MTTARGLDPITLEVVTERLIAVVREMRATMIRTSYSITIYEMKDFSCALFDGQGRMVAQSEDLPAHVVPMPWSVRTIMEEFAGDMEPGDIFLMNDPYRGGTHLNDVTMVYPIFEGDDLVLLAANRSHWDDVGGATPGSMSGRATEILQEGIRIPPIKVYERGRPVKAVQDLIYANMRVPEERQGDFRAMLATCRTAERRVHDLLARYGREMVLACIDRNIERTAERVRERIRQIPDGTYYSEDYIEFYHGGVLDPVMLRLALTVRDGNVHGDFTGTSAQVPGVANASLAVSAAGVVIALKALFDSDSPINHGSFLPITFTAPPGTLVNPTPPVPCGAQAEIRRRTLSMAVAALAAAIPDRIAGDMQGTSNHTLIGGTDERTGSNYVFYEVPIGGAGGFAEHDGPSVFATVDWADLTAILPVEAVEAEFPLEVVRSEIRADSCGHGRRRGGFGLRREVRLLGREASFSLVSDRAIVPPYGVLGGTAGEPNAYWVERRGDKITLSTPGKVTGFRLQQGDVLVACPAGGGGYGDPCEREPEMVAADLAAGLLSAEMALGQYGVAVDGAGSIDRGATAARRDRMRAARPRLRIVGESDSCVGELGKHRVFHLHPSTAAELGLGEGDLAELLGSNPAPLRGWVRFAAGAESGTVAVDEWGQRILGSVEGEWVRPRLLRRLQADDPPLVGSDALPTSW